MGFKQKFNILTLLTVVVIVSISVIGCYISYVNLSASVESALKVTLQEQKAELDGWLQGKLALTKGMVSLQESLGNRRDVAELQEVLGIISHDKDVLDAYYGNEADGKIVCFYAGDISAKLDPRTRGWYKDAKNSKDVIISDPYVDVNSNQTCVSVAMAYTVNKNFNGVIGADISIDILKNQVEKMNYMGEGTGYIIDKNGLLLATTGEETVMEDISSMPGVKAKFEEMKNNQEGYFTYEAKNGKCIFAYETIPSTGWVIGISVPEDVVFAPINTIRNTYIILTIISIVICVFMCIKLQKDLISILMLLRNSANELASGNLRGADLAVFTNDEIGNTISSFNEMKAHFRELITQMSSTSEQVSAASEELTANSNQSADSAAHIAETVNSVNHQIEDQLSDINEAKLQVDSVFTDINTMALKASEVTNSSNDTAVAAQNGSKLMTEAIEMMNGIEASVVKSAEMVRKLGDNSQEIGQIVDAISSISAQTNLLALNAAIEAARAGEAGRGFAVVAEEVRKLAAESQESAELIRKRIETIQTDTKKTVVSMEEGTNKVISGTHAIHDVGAQFNDILVKVNGIQTQIKEITSAVNTVTSGANKIVAAVDSIDSASRKNAENTRNISSDTEQQSTSNQEIATAAQSLADLADAMQVHINKFKV